jgi:hypothetical protein
MRPGFNKLVVLARVVHTYLTLFALPAVGFLAVTGLMLNHDEWFDQENPQVRTVKGTLPIESVHRADEPTIVEALRKDFGATGTVHDFETEEDQLRVIFQRPGRRTEATIQRNDGSVEAITEFRGAPAVMTELHKGTDAGHWWKRLIDLTAGLLILSVITGFIIWLPLSKRRRGGILAMLIGAAIWAAAYLLLIPN